MITFSIQKTISRKWYEYIYNIHTLTFIVICTNFRNRWKSKPLAIFSNLFRSECKLILYLKKIYVYFLCLSCNIKKSKATAKLSENSWKKRRSDRVHWCHLWRQHLYRYSFFLSFYMNQIPEILMFFLRYFRLSFCFVSKAPMYFFLSWRLFTEHPSVPLLFSQNPLQMTTNPVICIGLKFRTLHHKI